MKKETVKIIKEIAIIIFVPSIIVGAYHGWKYYKKKKDEKFNIKNKEAQTSSVNGEEYNNESGEYVIKVPSENYEKYFTKGEFFTAIKGINYSFLSMDSNGDFINVKVQISSTDLEKLKEKLNALNDKIIIENA